ncbi:uncharacterized protein LOC114528742 [Dendronephthya gigantea]|uniref:uncharacterized protein LOC114528742 n=1 Tax=Dendronephthya gigantea TaxID=151771 RepID=UPI00106B4316|nr:uncharacterized protein LOC114528742 [Dendronephthya gigantea]
MRLRSFRIRFCAALSVLIAITTLTTMYLLRGRICRRQATYTVPSAGVPKDVEKSVGPDEWIRRNIIDLKRECPTSLESEQKRSDLACKIPDIDPFHPSIMKLLRDVSMPRCWKYKSYGKLTDGKIHFLDPKVTAAKYRRIVRDGDFKYILGTSTPVPALNTTEKITDEFIEVEYLLGNQTDDVHKEIFIQPVPHEHLLKRRAEKQPGIPLNILIIGIDSLSHANAKRSLPKAYKYLKDELGSFIFNGLSIVGDGTTEQLTAMLTGLGELEQYESRRHHSNPKPVDGWRWIHKQLKERGYLTGYSADNPALGTWQYRLMGFKDPPTDFYPRPFYTRASGLLKGDMCLGSKTISKVQFDYIREVFAMFKNQSKFFFSYNDRYSHNANSEAAKIEPDLLSLLQDLKQSNTLNNTLLIIMGDHGARYGSARALMQGKLEERLPLFSMSFPPWVLEKYPEISKNLKTNTDRLTSWFDVYATFRHMLSYPEVPANLKHGQSLFVEVPISRTCPQASVKKHWCPCLEWVNVDKKHSHAMNSALSAVDFINNAILEHEKSAKNCRNLTIKNINYAMLERPNDKLLSFQQTNDLLPAFSDGSKPSHKDFCRYQIQFTTYPNNAIYEATVRYHKKWFIVSKDISRVNEYGNQPDCIARDLPHLRKFCMCANIPVNELENSLETQMLCD